MHKGRKKKVKRLKGIASRISDEGLDQIMASAEAACSEDPDCEPAEPPDPPPPEP